MTVTATSFKVVYPEFSTESDERVDIFLGKSALLVNQTKWGSLYDEGIETLTAHKLARANEAAGSSNGKGVGQLVSKNINDHISLSYARESSESSSNSTSQSEYSTTIYGKQYLALINRGVLPITIV
ncbi:MAG: DUF4054 domain-containing protein [Cyanobacteria bacterium J06554_11]